MLEEFYDILPILKEAFTGRISFSKAELEHVLSAYYDKMYAKATLRWRIHDLKERGIIDNISRGMYAFPGHYQHYKPYVSDDILKIHNTVSAKLPFASISFADSKWYNEFMIHQVFKTFIILEVEKEAIESVFHLVDDGTHLISLTNENHPYRNYISNNEQNRPLLITPLVSEAPLTKMGDINVASLEKLLIDCLAGEGTLPAQNAEANTIFKSAFEKYPVSVPKLRRYARRRNRADQIEKILTKMKGND